MDNLDLDAFIANIEQSAPKEEAGENKHKCQECETTLEEVDGNFICPNCSAQATNILQLEETELLYNDAGVAIVGQRVLTVERKKKHTIDYGWAWSTDEAVVHILGLQLEALDKTGLVPDYFRFGVKNMWYKFWVDNIAPHIKDEYNQEELLQISVDSALKLRDVEVLVKIQDKVMIPKRIAIQKKQYYGARKMMGVNFYQTPVSPLSQTPSPEESLICDLTFDDEFLLPSKLENTSQKHPLKYSTRNLNSDGITILTLNRTLAFLEGAARCMDLADPIFASDIIRACNQRLIPFYGAHKALPDGMKLNPKDRLMFQKNRPPTPIQLTRAASLLIHKIYRDKFPLLAPVPNLSTILERFIVDMNLPRDLLNYFKATHLDFSCFKYTQPLQLCYRRTGVSWFPQYDRWAFAILLFHLKRLFVLDKKGLDEQRQAAKATDGDVFIFYDWARQMSMRLHLILSYDSYMLFHPMTELRDMQPTPQLYNYVQTLLNDRVLSTTRTQPKKVMTDEAFRSELTEFLKVEIPRPSHLDREMPDENHLQKPIHPRYPIQDAFTRTKRFWISEICHKQENVELLFKDFSFQKVVTIDNSRMWTIYDDGVMSFSALKYFQACDLSPNWPYCFKLLLSIGGYLCYCDPKELLREYKHVEEFMYPHLKVLKKKSQLN